MMKTVRTLVMRSVGSTPNPLNDARRRRDALAKRLADAEALLRTTSDEATAKALKGASDAELDDVEAARREIVDRISTLQSALRDADETVASLEAEAQAEDRMRKRQEAIHATEALAIEIEAAQPLLVDALRRMAGLMKRADPIVWQANRVACICETMATELASAQDGLIHQLHHHAAEMLAGYRETKAPGGIAHE